MTWPILLRTRYAGRDTGTTRCRSVRRARASAAFLREAGFTVRWQWAGTS